MGSKEPRNLGKGDVQGFQLSGSQDCQGCWFKMQTPTLLRDSNSKKTDAHGPKDGPLRSPESNSTHSKLTARTTGKIDLEEEVGGGKKEAGSQALEQREKTDLRLGHLSSGLSELHRSE